MFNDDGSFLFHVGSKYSPPPTRVYPAHRATEDEVVHTKCWLYDDFELIPAWCVTATLQLGTRSLRATAGLRSSWGWNLNTVTLGLSWAARCWLPAV